MTKSLSITILILASISARAETTTFEAGVYENLLIAVSKEGVVTGYYREAQGEGVVKTCEFSLEGEAKNGVASVAVWGDQVFRGQIKAGAEEIKLTIEKGREIPGCGLVLMPEIATGISLDLSTKASWTELRHIASEKSFFHSEPKDDKRLKAYLVKGDVVGVVASEGEWLQIDYYSSNGKMSRRWINAQDTARFNFPKK